MTTIHLGDCQNGCETCEVNYHENFIGKTCDTCNREIGDFYE